MRPLRARASEEGSALTVALLTLLILLPLALLLSASVLRWQRQATDFRDRTEAEFLVRSGVADAELRLGQGRIRPAAGESSRFETELEGITVRVRVERKPDIVLDLGGRILDELEAQDVDLDAVGLDGTLRRVRQYRLLEVYLVEARARPRPSLPEIRVSRVLVRDGRPRFGRWAPLQQIGLKTDRRFYQQPRRAPGPTPRPWNDIQED